MEIQHINDDDVEEMDVLLSESDDDMMPIASTSATDQSENEEDILAVDADSSAESRISIGVPHLQIDEELSMQYSFYTDVCTMYIVHSISICNRYCFFFSF